MITTAPKNANEKHMCEIKAFLESLEKTYIFLTIITILGSREGCQGNMAMGAFM